MDEMRQMHVYEVGYGFELFIWSPYEVGFLISIVENIR